MSGTFKYKAFISYSHDNEAFAARLHNRLENWHPDGESDTYPLRPVFRDKEELSAGGILADHIKKALLDSENLIVIATPESAASFWVNEEIKWFLDHRDVGQVFTIIAKGDPPDIFPPALRDLDPAAPDFRRHKDGWHLGFSRLVSGLLDRPLDSIIRRDERQRRRKRYWTVGLTTAAFLVVSGLAGAAVLSESKARKRQAQAEDLVDFMLHDLRDSLEKLGRLDVLYPVTDKVGDYYAETELSGLSPDGRGRYALNLQLIADLKHQERDVPEIPDLITEAYGITKRQLDEAPDNPERIFEHAQSEYWMATYLGYIWSDNSSDMSLMERAEDHYQNYLDLAEKLLDLDPDSERAQLELAYALQNLGSKAQWIDRDPQTGEIYFSRALELTSRLMSGQPSPDAIHHHFNLQLWLAQSFEHQHRMTEAEKLISESSRDIDLQLANDRSDIRLRYRGLVQKSYWAQLAFDTGKADLAEQLFMEVDQEIRPYIEVDDVNKKWSNVAAFNLHRYLIRFYQDFDKAALDRLSLELEALQTENTISGSHISRPTPTMIKLLWTCSNENLGSAERREAFNAASQLVEGMITDNQSRAWGWQILLLSDCQEQWLGSDLEQFQPRLNTAVRSYSESNWSFPNFYRRKLSTLPGSIFDEGLRSEILINGLEN